MQTAYIHDGIIADFVAVPEGFQLEDVRTPDFLALCVQVPDEAQVGWTWDGKTAAAPKPLLAAPAVPAAYGDDLITALSDAELAAMSGGTLRDQRMLSARRAPFVPSDDTIIRLAGVMKVDPAAWFARLTPSA